MSNRFTKAIRLLIVVVFLLGVITAGVGSAVNYARTPRGSGHTITYTQTFVSADGKRSLNATKVRYQRADTTWKEIATYYNPDGTVLSSNTSYSLNGRGVFALDEKNKRLNFIGPRLHQVHQFSEVEVRKDPGFVREDSVLGYKTLVIRSSDDEGSEYSEFHRAPALQGANLKTVFASGEGHSTIFEATEIERGEPAASEFAAIPDYPVNYAAYEKKIRIQESRGNHELAEQMRQALQQHKQNVQ